ncbi:MAG: sugar phosphate isomerase/epimerase [Clostridia bacterium]|nr:sugar phosphate isomerase/epimerase [Clostridia bacterium]
MKISVNTYSLGGIANDAGKQLNMIEMADFAKSRGFDAIEFVGLEIPENMDLDVIGFAKYMKKYCEKIGLEISGYTVGADFLSPGNVERLKKEVDVAAALGAPVMRHDIVSYLPEGKTYFDLIPEFAKDINVIADYAASLGVKTCTENHGYVSQGSERVIALYKAVNNKNFGLLADFGNFLCVDEEPVKAVAAVAPFAFHVHAKDFKYVSKEESKDPPPGYFNTAGGNHIKGCVLGEGIVNVKKCIEIMKRNNYDSYITVEYEEPFVDKAAGVEKCIAYMKSCL